VSEKKTPKPKDPNIYVYAIEYGFPSHNIPPRPLVGNTFRDFYPTFVQKVELAKNLIRSVWK
jgi:hypothetical protein